MSISVTTDIHCDGCADWHHGVTSNRVQATAARANSPKGWYSYRGLDFCVACVADHTHIRKMEERFDK